jgi:hypothetical protein
MAESWRDLRVGDHIRIVRYPTDWERPDYHVATCTRRLYRRLIARRRPVRVYEVDGDGLPWVRCRFRLARGWEHHFLAVNDDSWVRVRGRNPGSPLPVNPPPGTTARSGRSPRR